MKKIASNARIGAKRQNLKSKFHNKTTIVTGAISISLPYKKTDGHRREG